MKIQGFKKLGKPLKWYIEIDRGGGTNIVAKEVPELLSPHKCTKCTTTHGEIPLKGI